MRGTDLVVPVGADEQQVSRPRAPSRDAPAVRGSPTSSHCRSSRNSASGCSGRANTPRKRRNTSWKRACCPAATTAGTGGCSPTIKRELGDEVDHELAVGAERRRAGCARHGAISSSLLLRIWRTRLWKACASVAYGMSRLYWSNLPAANKPARRHQRLVQLVDERRLADAGIAGHQHEFGRAAARPARTRRAGGDLGLTPVQLLRDRGVDPARRARRAGTASMRRRAFQAVRHSRRSASRPAARLVAVLCGSWRGA